MACDSKSDSIIIRSIPESNLSARTCINGETAGLSKDEIIDSSKYESVVYCKAQVSLKEAGASHSMLIRKFSSVCCTDTKSTWLC